MDPAGGTKTWNGPRRLRAALAVPAAALMGPLAAAGVAAAEEVPDIDPQILVEAQAHDGDMVEACEDDCGRPIKGVGEIEEPLREVPSHDEDYGGDYPYGCGEDELVACPDEHPTAQPGDHPDEHPQRYPEPHAADGADGGLAQPAGGTPLDVAGVEVDHARNGGAELAHTGSDGMLPLMGAGLLGAGGIAAALSVQARRNRPQRP